MPIIIVILLGAIILFALISLGDPCDTWEERKQRFRVSAVIAALMFGWLYLFATSPYRNDKVITEHEVKVEDNKPYVIYNDEYVNVAEKLGESITEGDIIITKTREPEWHYGIRSLELTEWSLKDED